MPYQFPFKQTQDSWWLDILFLILILGSLFFILLGARPLFVPDEGRYAEIAREMVQSGDYITPYLNHIKYFEKPILFYWLSATAIKLAGLSIWSLRSVNALLALMGCLLTYFTGRKLYNRRTGFLAALILGTNTLYFVMAHMVNLDLTVTVFLTTSLYAFLLGIQHPPSLTRRLYLWSASAFAAFAVLTKGLIGIAFPLLIIGVWMMCMGEWRLLKRLYLPSCLCIFFAFALPWHVIINQHHPEFFHFYFINQHILRYTTPGVGHDQPGWFFIPFIIIGFFPWIVFLPQAIAKPLLSLWQRRREHAIEIFFLLWIVIIFTFFSFSKSKLIPYILPIFPPLAILTAHYLQQIFQHHNVQHTKWRSIKIGYLFLLVLSTVIATVFFTFTRYTAVPDPKIANYYLYIAAIILILGTLAGCFYAYRHRTQALVITFSTAWLFLLFFLAAMPAIDSRSIRPLALALKPILKPQDEVITFNQYYQDLPFYLEQRVTILNWRNELSYGIKHQDTHEWMINDQTFWQRWQSKQRVFILIDAKKYARLQQSYPHATFHLLAKTLTNVLASNKAN